MKRYKIILIIIFALALLPIETLAEEKKDYVIDFTTIHHIGDSGPLDWLALHILQENNKIEFPFDAGSTETGTEIEYIKSPEGKQLINADIAEFDGDFSIYPIHQANGVTSDDNIEFTIPEEYIETLNNDSLATLNSSLLGFCNEYGKIIVKFGEDAVDSPDIVIKVYEDDYQDKITSRESYSFWYITNKLLVITDDGKITNKDGKVLIDENNEIGDEVTKEDNIIYEITEEDRNETYSRFSGKSRIIVQFVEAPIPEIEKEIVDPIKNPETYNNVIKYVGLFIIIVILSAAFLKYQSNR